MGGGNAKDAKQDYEVKEQTSSRSSSPPLSNREPRRVEVKEKGSPPPEDSAGQDGTRREGRTVAVADPLQNVSKLPLSEASSGSRTPPPGSLAPGQARRQSTSPRKQSVHGGSTSPRRQSVSARRQSAAAMTGTDISHNWPSGATYRGGMQRGKLHGIGRYVATTGAVYDGEYESDVKHGWGEQKLPTGEFYIGMYSHGAMHGIGRYHFGPQGEYRGWWVDNNIEGFGVFEKPDGRYIGEWKANQRNGRGYVVRNPGRDDQEQYEGDWMWDKEHGKGLHITANAMYYGVWKEGQRDGPGLVAEFSQSTGESVRFVACYRAGTLLSKHRLGTREAEEVLDSHIGWQDTVAAGEEHMRRDRRAAATPSSWYQSQEAEMRARYQIELAEARQRRALALAGCDLSDGPSLSVQAEMERKDQEIEELKRMAEIYKQQLHDAQDRLKERDKELLECGKSIVWLKQQLHDERKEHGEGAPQIESRIAADAGTAAELNELNETLRRQSSCAGTEDDSAGSPVSPRIRKRDSLRLLRSTVQEKVIVPHRNKGRGGPMLSPQSFVRHIAEANQKAQDAGQRIDELSATINLLNGENVEETVVESMQGTVLGGHLQLRQRIDQQEQELAALRASKNGAVEELTRREEQLAEDRERLAEQLGNLQEELLKERETVRQLKEMMEQASRQQAAESSEERAAMALELEENRREAAEKAQALDRIQQELEVMRGISEKAGQKALDQFSVQLQAANERVEAERDERKKLEDKLAEQSAALETRDSREERLRQQTLQLEEQRRKLEGDMNMLANQKQELELGYKAERANARRLHNEIEDMKGKIRVYARTRPLNDLERSMAKGQTCLSFPDEFSLVVRSPQPGHRAQLQEREYVFDRTFPPESTQEEVFEDCQNLIQSAVNGFNVCVFAYGQTGSGKTWTLSGTDAEPGLARRAMRELFDIKKRMEKHHTLEISCYMVELYNDALHDLLLPANAEPAKLAIKKDSRDMVCVVGSTELPATTYDELFAIFVAGLDNRTTRTTRMNSASSRSHMVFSIRIHTTHKQEQSTTLGKLSICDLAGSERLAKTELTDKQGIAEAKAINSSLTALGNVISALSKQERHIPYRDNKLTQLMADSLGGNAKTLMFVNVSPSMYNVDETVSSLNYAARVKLITNQATKQVETQEVKRLKAQIAKLKQGVMVDEYKEIE
eukprot:TRINITY_DN14745_c0_g2_i1.p1 TRINITY_DN14745_c0_g2~~TRINITY_DN14745_c0_g2_i1.p1  ORF type:complete len:1190 (+),score=353.65 TRINITY_DN14745_c0_g2_i1:156-3725(+)